MPILFSQLVMRHILYVIAVVDAVFLGVCGCLLLFPSGRSSLAGFQFSQVHVSDSDSIAPASAVPDQPGLADASFHPAAVTPVAYDATAPGDRPAAPAVANTTVVAASVSGDIFPDGRYQDQPYVSTANRVSYTQPAGSSASYTYIQPSVASSTYYDRSAEPSSPTSADSNATASQAATPQVATPPQPSVPVAFTTPPDGATPAQAAALTRLQNEFADQVAASGQGSTDPGYEEAWDAAQALSDSNYAQQFGWQAFVEAQLAQFHGSGGN